MTPYELLRGSMHVSSCGRKRLGALRVGTVTCVREVLTMAANAATVSAGSGALERRRKRRDTSRRGMASRPHERQMDTAFVDHADWKLSLGPTWTSMRI